MRSIEGKIHGKRDGNPIRREADSKTHPTRGDKTGMDETHND
ncbi:MAG: hypothetical protein ACE5D3_03825 [Candidatus Binatia bacterium]